MAFIDGNNGENFMTVMGLPQHATKPKDEIEQPQILQCDCVECSLYDGFGQCLEHGSQLVDNCKDFLKRDRDMECKELMLGDYVQVNGEVCKVISISFFDIGISDTKEDFYHEHIDNIKPIPLTPEILEQNGFELQRDKSEIGTLDTYWLGSELGAFRIHRLNNGDYQFGLAKISNVHELQHALRLCDINKEIRI